MTTSTPNLSKDGNNQRVRTHETSREADYWASFYEKADFTEGSSFFDLLSNQDYLPGVVLDIGCGEGRDSFAFAQIGKTVVGLDRSEVGVDHAGKKAEQEGLADKLSFGVCDVSNEIDVYEVVNKVREMTDEAAICFYMRFFLHSIPEDVQEKLMAAIADLAKPGDVFAAEFRTDKDEERDKVFGNTHYRRYQNAAEFSERLTTDFKWDNKVLEVEDRGLSPYKEEDPVLYRVIAIKS